VADVQIAEGTGPKHKGITFQRALPYLLSLPALLVCIGILIRSSLPSSTRCSGTTWHSPTRGLSSGSATSWRWPGPAFWHTVLVSLEYTA